MELQTLLCTGDPILDIYIDGDGSMRHFNGGALNIYQNIVALLLETDLCMKIEYAYPSDGDFIKGDVFNCYTICRTPLHEEGIALASDDTKEIFYTPCGIPELVAEYKPDILVLGDYNKGVLNTIKWLDDDEFHGAECAIVDSRYRSLDMRWINKCKLKIWHATDKEYDKEWAKNFDYVYWTAGPKPVVVLKGEKPIATIEVPSETKIVNTCGSGDTFTASIAACIFAYKDVSEQALISYAKFAIGVCQDVVSQPYTSTTKKRINIECTLQT
ncbi:MAG: hypothetical protein CMF69_00445 [Magnetovibrio sp.]|nr:hypothetical protein [Magnetovibrio sp.]